MFIIARFYAVGSVGLGGGKGHRRGRVLIISTGKGQSLVQLVHIGKAVLQVGLEYC